ncbi:hypothetical protein [Actinoplanes xinjiangensis]|nr:hypothetical protein [Actinoplanes xinjiangensis]GIF40245.1 hypothetical protein Axi01nite_45560 [Actinoplanes xinjiangensis]
MTDDDSISFAHSANDAITRIRDAVQDAVDATHGIVRPTPRDSTGSPDSRGGGEPMISHPRGASGVARPVAGPTATAAPSPANNDALHASREADHRYGSRDGARAATTLPLAALDSLVACHFDLVQWLGPWRRQWQRALSQPSPASPTPIWLADLAQYLGGHAAPPGAVNSTFAPTPAYLTGFCAGMRNAWHDAVAADLLPADRDALTWWMAQPADWLRAGAFLAEATIGDLSRARRRKRRAAATRKAARIALWAATGLFLVMEIFAIVISIQGGWVDGAGRVAADQAPDTIFANLACSIPLVALCTLVVIDLKRSRRNAAAKGAPEAPTTDARQPE